MPETTAVLPAQFRRCVPLRTFGLNTYRNPRLCYRLPRGLRKIERKRSPIAGLKDQFDGFPHRDETHPKIIRILLQFEELLQWPENRRRRENNLSEDAADNNRRGLRTGLIAPGYKRRTADSRDNSCAATSDKQWPLVAKHKTAKAHLPQNSTLEPANLEKVARYGPFRSILIIVHSHFGRSHDWDVSDFPREQRGLAFLIVFLGFGDRGRTRLNCHRITSFSAPVKELPIAFHLSNAGGRPRWPLRRP